MRTRICLVLAVSLSLALLLGSCKPSAASPTAQANAASTPSTENVEATAVPKAEPAATPTQTPTKPLIEPGNAASLTEAAQAALQNPYQLRWSADGKILGALTPTGLALLDGAGLTILANVDVKTPFALLDYTPDRGWMLVTSDQRTVELREISTGKLVRSIDPGSTLMSGAISPDGSLLVLASADEISATVWNIETGELVRKLSGFETAAPVYSVRFAPDGKKLIWIARATVQWMDIASGSLGPILDHEDFVNAIAMRPDMQQIACASAGTINGQFSGAIKLWDVTGGAAAATLPTGDTVSSALAYSPDGRLLVDNEGNKIVVWEISQQKKAATLASGEQTVNSAAFSPDGKTLATASDDGKVRLWQVAP